MIGKERQIYYTTPAGGAHRYLLSASAKEVIMFRRQMFYGITFILLIAIIFLLMRGRSAEKERAAQQNTRLAEIAAEPSSPVRAIMPRDLEIVDAKISWTRNSDEKDAAAAHHVISIRNTGEGSYKGLRLRIEYINEKKQIVETRKQEIDESLPPGETLRVQDIVVDGLPDAAGDARITILSADIV